MKRWKEVALATVGVVLLLAGLVAFVLPAIVKSRTVKSVEAATGRQLAIGGVSLNPLTWTVEVRDLRFSERGKGETFAAFRRVRIAVSPSSLFLWAPIIAEAHVTSPYLRIVRTGANTFNFSDLLKWLPRHLRFSLNNLVVTDGSVDFIDRGLPVEKRHELRKIKLAVPFLTTLPHLADRYITPRLSAVVNGSPLLMEGKLRPFASAVEASATIDLKAVSLPYYLAYVPGELPVQVEAGTMSATVAVSYRAAQKEDPTLAANGSVTLAGLRVADRTGVPLLALTGLDVAAHLDLGGPEGMRLREVSVQARQLSAPFGNREGMTLGSLSLAGGGFSEKENLLEANEVTLRDGDLRFLRDRKGVRLPLNLLRQEGKERSNGKQAATPPVRCRIGRISGSGMNAVFTDDMPAQRPSFVVRKIAFSLERLTGPPFGPIPFRVTGAYGREGSLRASGSLTPAPLQLKGELALQRIPLADFNAYLPKDLKLTVAHGVVDVGLSVSLAAKGDRLTGTFGGSTGVRSFSCLGAQGGDLLKWETLRLDNLKGNLAPFALDIKDVALSRFTSRIVVEKDGTLNLQHLRSAAREGRGTPKTAAGGKGKRVRIGTVTLQHGTLAFTDHHVTGGYATTLFHLGGRIRGLSSEKNRSAHLELRGSLENQSPLRITGRINPLRDDLFADLKVSFTDIELSPMTPYSGTYLGYAVDKGQLFLDSKYRIENRKLDSENKVFLDQLDFGRRIESDQATTLPVRRAVAVLKDRKGEIRLDLPVTGRTDDPQFSVWRVALEILKNLLVKAADSPFALLQSLFGWQEDLSSVGFAYGSAELTLGEREKLLKLATALNDRPALKIEVVGFVDRERDLASTVAGEQQLRSLAEARAAAVRAFLVEQGKMDAARVLQKSGDLYGAPPKEGESGSRARLDVAAE